eukprot:scaffold5037_cov114-Isochrysis_galbana.AAC.11
MGDAGIGGAPTATVPQPFNSRPLCVTRHMHTRGMSALLLPMGVRSSKMLGGIETKGRRGTYVASVTPRTITDYNWQAFSRANGRTGQGRET